MIEILEEKTEEEMKKVVAIVPEDKPEVVDESLEFNESKSKNPTIWKERFTSDNHKEWKLEVFYVFPSWLVKLFAVGIIIGIVFIVSFWITQIWGIATLKNIFDVGIKVNVI